MQIPHGPADLKCPLWRKSMSKVCHTCPWWACLKGKNPQGEDMIDEWRCSIPMLVTVGLEGAQQSRQAGAAVESFRNVMVEGIVDALGTERVPSMGKLIDARNHHR